jgi:hypothetical protein
MNLRFLLDVCRNLPGAPGLCGAGTCVYAPHLEPSTDFWKPTVACMHFWVSDRTSFLQRALDVLNSALPPHDEWMSELPKRWEQIRATGESALFTYEDSGDEFVSGWEVSLWSVGAEVQFLD